MRIRLSVPCIIALLLVQGCQPPQAEVTTQSELTVTPPPEPWKNTSFSPPKADAAAYSFNSQEKGYYPLQFKYSGQQDIDLKQELISNSLEGRTGGDPGQVSLLAFSTESVEHKFFSDDDGHRGFALRLINRTGNAVPFYTCDGDVFIVQEAYADIGGWTQIESRVSSFCGNSYGYRGLKPGCYWEFAAPEYDGSIRTKMRFRCDIQQNENGQYSSIYSNEFIGRVNPEQFVAKPRR